MSPRLRRPLVALALGALLTLLGCTDRSIDIEFSRTHHLEGQEEPEVVAVLPTSGILQAWGLAGGAFRGIELRNRGNLIQGVGAPEPPYWYRFNSQWVFTVEHAVNWEMMTWGRVGTRVSHPQAKVTVEVTGLEPWMADDDAHHALVAWGSGAAYRMTSGRDHTPAGAETSEIILTDLTLEDHGAIAVLPALKGEEGDSLHFVQLMERRVFTPAGEALFENDRSVAVVRGARWKEGLDIPAFNEPDREPAVEHSIELSAATVRTLDVETRGDGFDDVIADAGGVVHEAAETQVIVRPNLFAGIASMTTVEHPSHAFAVFKTPAVDGPEQARLTWTPDGMPGGAMQVAFSRTYEVNGSVVQAGVVQILGDASTYEAAPLVGAPGEILIDDAPVTGETHVSNPTPIIRWSAPTIGTATGYEVRIARFTENAGAISEVVYTTETQLRLPPVFMGHEYQEDQSFVVVVTARSDTSEGFPDRVQAPRVPYGYAARATPRFTAGSR